MAEQGLDLYRISIPSSALESLPARDAFELEAVPVEFSEHGVVVAMARVNHEHLEKLRFIWNRPVSVVYATDDAIQFALAKYYAD